MRNRIIYGIIKTYNGLFVKTHIGNIHILIIEMNKTFWVLNVLGQMENREHASQMILRSPNEYINIFIDEFERSENFIQLEEIFCNIPKESEDSFKILLKKKGKYLSGNYTISFDPEHSKGNVRVYMIEGNFNPLLKDSIKNKNHLTMKALKNQAISNKIINKFQASLKR